MYRYDLQRDSAQTAPTRAFTCTCAGREPHGNDRACAALSRRTESPDAEAGERQKVDPCRSPGMQWHRHRRLQTRGGPGWRCAPVLVQSSNLLCPRILFISATTAFPVGRISSEAQLIREYARFWCLSTGFLPVHWSMNSLGPPMRVAASHDPTRRGRSAFPLDVSFHPFPEEHDMPIISEGQRTQ